MTGETFEEFWSRYLAEHRNATCRLLHFVGTSLALVSVVAAAAAREPLWLAAALVAGYGFAWVGHFVFEKNRPVAFRHPVRSLRADLRMYRAMLLGRMPAELARLATS